MSASTAPLATSGMKVARLTSTSTGRCMWRSRRMAQDPASWARASHLRCRRQPLASARRVRNEGEHYFYLSRPRGHTRPREESNGCAGGRNGLHYQERRLTLLASALLPAICLTYEDPCDGTPTNRHACRYHCSRQRTGDGG